MKTIKTEFHRFLEKPEHRRLYEQEKLLVDAAELLSQAMETENVSRAELARRLGKSRSFVTQVLRGNHNMTLRTLADIFFSLDYQVSLQSLPVMDGTDSRSQNDWLETWVSDGERYRKMGTRTPLVGDSCPFAVEVHAHTFACGEDDQPCAHVAA
jgi:transcriptional regulator with XRE-family HTH domain